MSKNNRTLNIFWTIIATVVVCLIINMPVSLPVNIHFGKINWEHTFYRPPFEINIGGNQFKKNVDLKYGLDLAGGASVIFDIDTSQTTKDNLPSALESLST